MVAESIDERAIFETARQMASRDAREAYLQEICADHPVIGQRVRDLLKAFEESGSFLEVPALHTDETVSFVTGEWPTRISTADPQSPGAVVGPYKLLRKIGEGGMGTVYLAEQSEPIQRKVALKVIKPGMDSRQVVARFEAERQALSVMDHVNIARVLDAGATASGRPYFVMELIHGVPITKYCDDNHLTPRERLELFVPVCQAIQHAHQKGIIHRDIKPANVLVVCHS